MKTIRDFDVSNKRVLVRIGYDIPLDNEGGILDDFRIKKSLPTIKYLIENDAKVILISHIGRPESRDNRYSLKQVSLQLSGLLIKPVKFLDDCIGAQVEQEVKKMSAGEIILLENLRFYKEETECDTKFAKKLAKLGDIFIQDAFGVCHREHASITEIPKFLPSGIGLLIEQEMKILGELREKPQKPLVVIMGGAKVKTKIKALNKISEIADEILIGHLIEKEIQEQNFEIKNPQKIIGPIDSLEQDGKDLDIGPATIHLFEKKILKAKTIFWNGPLGDINRTRFGQGSSAIAKAIIASGAYSIVGGGDTVGFLGENDIREKFNFLSSGGGAMLVFLAGEPLPGLEALSSLEIEDRSNFMEKIRIHIFVSGKVQGVFFRDSTVKQAEKLGVFGWIQNLENNIVEAVFEGDKDKVDKIVKWVRKGPFFAKVKEIDIDEQRYTGEFKDFQIKYPELAETLKQAE